MLVYRERIINFPFLDRIGHPPNLSSLFSQMYGGLRALLLVASSTMSTSLTIIVNLLGFIVSSPVLMSIVCSLNFKSMLNDYLIIRSFACKWIGVASTRGSTPFSVNLGLNTTCLVLTSTNKTAPLNASIVMSLTLVSLSLHMPPCHFGFGMKRSLPHSFLLIVLPLVQSITLLL